MTGPGVEDDGDIIAEPDILDELRELLSWQRGAGNGVGIRVSFRLLHALLREIERLRSK